MQKILLVFFFMLFTSIAFSQKFRIVENSRIAKVAAKIKKEDKYAVTFGKTIFINCTKEEFFAEPWWVRHELVHVEQYKKYGIPRFLTLYLLYSIFHHYADIPFEKEAISAEKLEE